MTAQQPATAPQPAATPALLTGLGFTVRLPERWEGRVFQRPVPATSFTAAARAAGAGGDGWAGEATHPVLHLANFPLPPGRGDYGTGAVERMGSSDAFVALLQFGPAELGTPLFAAPGLPRIQPYDMDPAALQRRLAGQAGCQRFVTVSGRPLCLYVVLGSRDRLGPLCREVNAALDGIEVAA